MRRQRPDERHLTKIFKALSDSTRQQILELLEERERNVGEIVCNFNLSQPTISHHLRVLREAGLLDCERRGTWVYYRVVPSTLEQLSAVLATESGVLPASACTPTEALEETVS